VNGGQSRAIVGARVYVLQASNSSEGNSSKSLLTSSTGQPADAIGHYALTGEFGGFSIAGEYACTPGREVYLYARGGNSGGDGTNSAIGLMASLGSCPASGTFANSAPFVFVNEVTTIAAAFAMVGRASDPTHVSGSQTSSEASTRINAGNLADPVTGFARKENKDRQIRIHTLANILSACVNSSGPDTESCRSLFASARSDGSGGTLPEDTAAAAINIARHPYSNVAALYKLRSVVARPFQPALESEPTNFILSQEPKNGTTSFASMSQGQ
jgi:hypothetical protein